MTSGRILAAGSLAAVILLTLCMQNTAWNIQVKAPRAIEPGSASKAPSDAIVLFDGKNLDEWVGRKAPRAGR